MRYNIDCINSSLKVENLQDAGFLIEESLFALPLLLKAKKDSFRVEPTNSPFVRRMHAVNMMNLSMMA
jgi:hypothetical protein